MDAADAGNSFRLPWVVALLTMLALAGLLYGPATAPAQTATAGVATGTVDLAAVDELTAKFDLEPAGVATGDATYAAIRSAALLGDANGDGIGDMAIGDPTADPRGRTDAGSVYVVFGRRDARVSLSLTELGDRGYRIDGPAEGARLGASLAALGDANGDELADFAIGAPRAGVANRGRTGVVYIIRGDKRAAANLDLAVVNRDVPRLLGAASGDRTGWALAPLAESGGGPNGLIVGAPTGDPAGRGAAGSVYVLPAPLPRTGDHQLGELPASYRIDGAEPNGRAGMAVGASPDMSGDGLAEVLVGAPLSGPAATSGYAGAAFVVTSRPLGGIVDLAAPAGASMALYGDARMRLGASILGVGDVSGDGVPDVAVGAPYAQAGDRPQAGSVFIVAGRALSLLPIGLPAAADVVTRLDGVRRVDHFGASLARAGDLDRDAVADLLIAAPRVNALGRRDAGAVYAVRGRDLRSGRADIALLASSGVRLAGPAADDFGGSAFAGGLDAGGATRPDVLVVGLTRAAALDLPAVADEPSIPEPTTTGCVPIRDIELVVDDSRSLETSDPLALRRAAIELMLSKPRDVPVRLGAIEIGQTAAEVFAPLSIEASGLGPGTTLETLRGLVAERIRNDAGATDFGAGLAAAVRHNPRAGAIVLITDATEPAPAAPLAEPGGRPVYVLELRGPKPGTRRAEAALVALARATRGGYFAAVDAESLPAALGAVEAGLRCEQTLTTEAFSPQADPAPRPLPPGQTGAVVQTDDVIATATAAPAAPAIFDTGLPATTSAITMTFSYAEPRLPRTRARARRPSCLAASPVILGSVEVIASDSVSVRATAAQLRQALRGRLTPLGEPGDGRLYARGRCGRGYLTLRITGLERVRADAPGAQAASSSARRARSSARPRRGKKLAVKAGVTGQRRSRGRGGR